MFCLQNIDVKHIVGLLVFFKRLDLKEIRDIISLSRCVTQIRDCVPWGDFTRYPTEMITSRL